MSTNENDFKSSSEVESSPHPHLPNWPPNLSQDQLHELTTLATTYALSHGLLYLPPTPPPTTTSIPSSAIHAPIALVPSPFPRHLFENAKRLQRMYNVLYARIALDVVFLDKVMGEDVGVGRVDEFTGKLWRGWKALREEEGLVQPLHLGIFRSDYLLHAPSSEEPISLKQVEFNTISSSFGPLSERVAGLHRYLLASTNNYYNSSPYLSIENLASNTTTKTIVDGLAAAHHAYGIDNAKILFVVQPNERNVFDQRWLEYDLLERHSIHVIRQTFDQLASSAQLNPSTSVLSITSPSQNSSEISTIYFRAGYTPIDYPTSSHYATRFLLEKSRAIKCPSIALQLAGGKKVQQVLTGEGILERFLLINSHSNSYGNDDNSRFTKEDLNLIRESWMTMWGLSDPNGISRAIEKHESLVLKPQREGGGNNIYKSSIPSFISTLPEQEREAWIAMELINFPKGVQNYLIRAGGGGGGGNTSASGEGIHHIGGAVKTEAVSELGIFGWALFGFENRDGENGGGGDEEDNRKRNAVKIEENEGGWLVRTKGTDSDEGGVAVGFSVLDSVVLV